MTTPAQLPEANEEKNIFRLMKVGEVGYTVPWAMNVAIGTRSCYLNPEYTFHHRPGGTAEMRVERRADGFHIWIVPEFKYRPSANADGIPVAKLHT